MHPTLPASPTALAAPPLPARYQDLGLLGEGGQSVVRRVHDALLGREVALKLPRGDGSRWEAFRAEARRLASLSHPGIVPVHDLGDLQDGRPYFTMPVLAGHTLAEGVQGAPPQRVELAARVGDVLGYAHARGVVHGDLKPANVILGAHGEVLLLDWGLGRAPGERFAGPAGTPAFMAPELACGEPPTPASDVYALGALLYTLLVGQAPFDGLPADTILARLRAGDVPGCPVGSGIRPDLAELVEAAMAPTPGERPPGAGALAAALRAWAADTQRREAALRLVREAEATIRAASDAERAAGEERAAAEAHLAGIPAWAPEREKEQGWSRREAARSAAQAASLARAGAMQQLREAIGVDPGCRRAHDLLADHHRDAQARAEAAGDEEEARRQELLVRAHGARRHARWLEGDGALTLHTDPPGAEVELHRYVRGGGRLRLEPAGTLGRTPLDAVPLRAGSWLVVLRHPDRAPVRYPVHVGRLEHWDGRPPGESAPVAIRLPRLGELPDTVRYVPPGWALLGDLQAALARPPGRVWVDGFLMDRDPLSNRALLALLDEADRRGLGGPRPIPRAKGPAGAALYGRSGEEWHLLPDADGELWDPDWPVFLVDWFDALAVADLRARLDGRPWRLPGEAEWEKAARGADGRRFPWGPWFDPSFCWMRESHPGRPLPVPVGLPSADESPYGIRALAGNMRCWCADVVPPGSPSPWPTRAAAVLPEPDRPEPRAIRGGSWLSPANVIPSATHQNTRATERSEGIGIRLATSWP